MPNLKPYTGDAKLVVAFDVGMTFSHISYCILEQGQVPEVDGVLTFPGQQPGSGGGKVPSILYYDKSGNVRAAGDEALSESVIDTALTEGWTKAERWKLHLRPKYLPSSITKDDELPPLPAGKSAIDVFTDFTKYLFQCAKTYIQKHHPAFLWLSSEDSIHYIFTHPNGWEGVPQQIYRRAIERAGLVPSTPEGRSRVHMLSEGEVSFHFCMANLSKAETVNQASSQGVVIVDAGRRTIELSMFSVTSNPISCEEIAPAECLLQGSEFVTRRARLLLERKLEGWEHSTSDEIAEFTREFDQTTKLMIKSDQEPAYIRVAGRRTCIPRYSISSGKLKLTGEEATSLFKESIDAIIQAFEQQQTSTTTPITMAFVVGGFSTNDWVWSQLELYFKSKNVDSWRPDNHTNKTVPNGAVLSHVDRDNHKVSRIARVTYGLVCALPVKANDAEHIRRKHQWERDPAGDFYVPDHFEAKLYEGAKVCEEMEFRESFSLTKKDLSAFGEQTVRLVCYRGNISKPEWVNRDASAYATLCTITVDLSQAAKDVVPKKKLLSKVYQLDYDVIIFFGLTELKAELGWKTKGGERRIPAIVSFEEDWEGDARQWRGWGHHRDSTPAPLIAQVAQIENASAAMTQQIAALREDNGQKLRDEISVYSSRTDGLERSQHALSVDLSSARRELEVKTSLIQERDRMIASFTTEVAQLKKTNVEKTKQVATLRQDCKDLQERCGAQAEENLSLHDDLRSQTSLIQEKDRTIASFTTEVAQLKKTNIEKTEQVATLRQDCEDLQERCSARAEEILSLRDDLRSNASLPVEEKCVGILEGLGDAALSSGKYEEAIACYSSALSLNPAHTVDILVKRSNARASKGLWEGALTDAIEVIKLDPSSHRGYEMKYVALHGAENYVEADNALLYMLSIIEKSPDEGIHRPRENYTTLREAGDAIDAAIREVFNLCPLVLIDLDSGRLCDAHERVRMFKSETPFKKLVFHAVTTKLDRSSIRQAVARYFTWIMFSHTWDNEKEPTFQDINMVESVWKLDNSPLNEKLRQFCTTSREDGHRWAWSDTCCIDKTTSAVLSQSLTSMYRWYEEAAETLVYLADVSSACELGALMKSRWMTRAWTLQELLASGVIQFYTRDWKLYLNDMHRNHKQSPAIKLELAKAIGVAPDMITSFRPKDLGVREKLRLASTRNASVDEDIAYSLIGIFSSDITPRYGSGKEAVGQLLENIVARTGDVTVISWTGKSSSYNSALPDSLAVYSQPPYSPQPMGADELEGAVEQLRTGLATRDHALAFYRQVIRLPRATFSNRCLQLPCIVFRVTKTVKDLDDSQGTLFHTTVSSLGRVPVDIRTTDAIPLKTPKKHLFVHPWLCDVRDPLDDLVFDDEQEVEPDDDDHDSDDSIPATPLPAEPLAPVDHYQQALRLIARLGRPFNALLLERQNNNQYKRIATDCKIMSSGVPYQTNPKDLRAKVLEIV